MSAHLSFRGKRLERRANEQRRGGTLNVVSLMDIFTILVFFLLVNASDVEVLPSPRALDLPESVAEERAREVPVIMITRDDIMLQHGSDMRTIVSLAALQEGDRAVIAPLRSALLDSVGLLPIEGDERGRDSRGEINIMADKDTPYATLRRVMATATQAQFANISLTVLQRMQSQEEAAQEGGAT